MICHERASICFRRVFSIHVGPAPQTRIATTMSIDHT